VVRESFLACLCPAVAGSLFGCGAADSEATEWKPTETESAPSEDAVAAAGGYPGGPYGEANPEVSHVVENLAFRGLFNLDAAQPSADLPVAAFDFEAFRESGARYLLITTAMGWCGSCQIAASELGNELSERVAAANRAGGLVAQILLEGKGSEPPSDAELGNWATAADLSVSVLGPASERVATVFPQREWGFILRLDTMQVVWRTQVALYATPTVSGQGVDELERRLGE
jgi:hypothetical protein